jgi:hypothetical protein
MKIEPAFNHMKLMSHNVDRIIALYASALEFRVGRRPPFNNEGDCLYLGDFSFYI